MLVWNWIVSLFTDDAKLERGIKEFAASRETELGRARERLVVVDDLIKRAEKRIERLTKDLDDLESDSARAAIKEKINTIGREKDSLLAEQWQLETEIAKREITFADAQYIREKAHIIRRKLNGKPTYEEKRALFDVLELSIEIQHQETGRALFVKCGLKMEGATLPLPARKNYAVNNSSSTAKSHARIPEILPNILLENCILFPRPLTSVQNISAIHHVPLD